MTDEDSTIRSNELVFELDGPGVHPESVPAQEFLALASAFIDLLAKLAALDGEDDVAPATAPEFLGVRVFDKCAALAVTTSDLERTRALGERALRLVAGNDEPPDGTLGLVQRIQTLRLGTKLEAKVFVGPGWSRGLQAKEDVLEATRLAWERTSLRVIPIKVGGKRVVRATLESPSEMGQFSLIVDREIAKALARHIYDHVEAELRIRRDGHGRIREGRLESFEPVEVGDARLAWQTWYRQTASSWDDIDDVEGELDRG